MRTTTNINPGSDIDGVDRLLVSEEAMVPSSGFLAAVMQRVEDEARAPEPIHFPWKRALPGFVLAASAVGWAGFELGRQALPALRATPQAGLTMPAIHISGLQMSGLQMSGLHMSGIHNLAGGSPLLPTAAIVLSLGTALACWRLTRWFASSSASF